MKALLEHIQHSSHSQIDVIIYVGTGNTELLPILRRFNAKRLVMCEPNPAHADTLNRELDPARGESVLPYALVSDDAPSTDLHILNNTRYNSTASPLGILDFRPNLKVEHTISVPAKQIASVIETLDPSAENTNLLILNAVGCNAELLSAIPSNLLCRFEWLLVTGMQVTDCFVGDNSITAIGDFLQQEQRFNLAMNDGEAIHPSAAALFHRHPLALRLLETEARVGNLQQALQDTSKIAERRHQQLQGANAERDALTKLAAEHAAQIASLTQAKASADELLIDHQKQIEQLSQDRNSREMQLAELRAQLLKTEQSKAELENQLKQHQAQIGNLTKARDEQAKLATERHAALHELRQEHDAQTKIAEERAAQVANLTQAKASAEKLASEQQNQIQLLTNERATRDKQLAELTAQLQQTQQSKAELENQLKQHQAQIENLTKGRDEEINKSEQYAKRVAQLEAERAELDTRQHLFSGEMIRAEAQIDLIKDVLLREPAL